MSTPAGIRRIIAQLGERTSGVFVCPICEGGSTRERSLNIHLRDGIWLWFCHRGSCPTKGALAADGAMRERSAPAFEPRPLTLAYRTPSIYDGDPVALRVERTLDGPPCKELDFALAHGLRVLESDPGTHVWELFNVHGQRLGHVTRTEDKFIRTWRVHNGPFYGYFDPPVNLMADGPVVIVEDPLSAALLAHEGLRAIALLGTNLTQEAAQEITCGLPLYTKYVVALDGDRAGMLAAERVMERVRACGPWVSRWTLQADVKNMTPTRRRDFVSDVREATNR